MAAAPIPSVICSTLIRHGSSVALEALEALEWVLSALPGDAPGIAIIQHLPEKFSAMYPDRPNGLCTVDLREARDGDRLERGAATGTHDPVGHRGLAVLAEACSKACNKWRKNA